MKAVERCHRNISTLGAKTAMGPSGNKLTFCVSWNMSLELKRFIAVTWPWVLPATNLPSVVLAALAMAA